MRRAARTDENQSAIVKALEKVGATVTSLHWVGEGVPDLLVSFRQRWHLIEIKNPARHGKQRRLRPTQQQWSKRQQAAVHVVETADEALTAIGAGDSEAWRRLV